MKRLPLILIALLTLAIGIAEAVPAKRPYEPPEPEAPDLRGTTWIGYNEILKADWVVIFETNGEFTYTYSNNKFSRVGTWKLEGNTLYYETAKKYAEFRGTLQGDTIQGQAWNVNNQRWQILLHRAPAK